MGNNDFEVLIAGGGRGGMGAALILGRMARTVGLIDSGEKRNSSTDHIRGYLTRDGISPGEFDSIAHNELQKYPSVRFVHGSITDAKVTADGLMADFDDGSTVTANR